MADGPEPCPACGGRLAEVKAKLVCERCHRIAEGCCEGQPPRHCDVPGRSQSSQNRSHSA
jgi:hypothetical protein